MSVKSPSAVDTTPEDDHVEQVVSLLPFELSIPIMQIQYSSSTLTWYKMDKDQTLDNVARSLHNRLTDILEVNPWLGGRIKTRNRAGAIVYTPAQSKKQANTILTVYKDIPVSVDTPYPQVSALLQRTVVPLTYWSVWNWNVPFFRVALVSDYKNPERFALVSSLAHCVGDGHTYYKLHNMLAHEGIPIEPLRIQRKHYMHDMMTKTMGGPEYMGVYSVILIGFLLRAVRSVFLALIVGPPTAVKLFRLNEDWIKEQKREGLLTSNNNNSKLTPPPKYLSTNDVMASQFFCMSKCDQALMTVNFRGKIPDCHDSDAGNYFNFNTLRWAEFCTPVGIRTVVNQLSQGQRFPTTRPMTSLEHLFAKTTSPISFFTNVVDFQRPVRLAKCQHLGLHMPLVPTHSLHMPARLFSYCYMFNPDEKCVERAVMVSITAQAMKELEATGMMGPELKW